MRRRVKDPEVGKLVPWTGLAVEFRDAGDSDVRRGSERKGKRCCRGGGQGQGQERPSETWLGKRHSTRLLKLHLL